MARRKQEVVSSESGIGRDRDIDNDGRVDVVGEPDEELADGAGELSPDADKKAWGSGGSVRTTDSARAATVIQPVEPVVEHHDKDRFVCLDGNYTEHAEARERPRTILVGNVRFEHTHDDGDGVWCYRAM